VDDHPHGHTNMLLRKRLHPAGTAAPHADTQRNGDDS
jgi:hypothetical protein